MDFIKKAASQYSESVNSSNYNGQSQSQDQNNQQSQSQSQSQNQDQNNQQAQQQQNTTTDGSKPTTDNNPSTQQSSDYGDKAFDFASKKAGYDLSPEMDEKVTDGLRSAYESYSGKKVDGKYSN